MSHKFLSPHSPIIKKSDVEDLLGHKAFVVWFTGLSGAGKTTLANKLSFELYNRKINSIFLDGDNIRHGLCSDLGFSIADRSENIRRVAELGKIIVGAGVIVIAAFISPMASDRRRARDIVGADNFIEIYCRCPVSVCENRDVKGLYKKARSGIIKEFTGIDSPYEEPIDPDLIIDTSENSIDHSIDAIFDYLLKRL